MSKLLVAPLRDTHTHQIVRGTVLAVRENDYLVAIDDVEESAISCQVLHSSEQPLAVACGDAVLILSFSPDSHLNVILGRVGPSRGDVAAMPDELVLEARDSLTLRVGDGSITIRADGKILIKGKDLVSHAQRVNRIKGGSVAIN